MVPSRNFVSPWAHGRSSHALWDSPKAFVSRSFPNDLWPSSLTVGRWSFACAQGVSLHVGSAASNSLDHSLPWNHDVCAGVCVKLPLKMGRYTPRRICDGLTSVESDGARPGGAGICPWPRGVARPSDFSMRSECTQMEVQCVLSKNCIKACTRFSLIARLDAVPLHEASTL